MIVSHRYVCARTASTRRPQSTVKPMTQRVRRLVVATLVTDRASTLLATACTLLIRTGTLPSVRGGSGWRELSHGPRSGAGAARGRRSSVSRGNAANASAGSSVRLSGMMTIPCNCVTSGSAVDWRRDRPALMTQVRPDREISDRRRLWVRGVSVPRRLGRQDSISPRRPFEVMAIGTIVGPNNFKEAKSPALGAMVSRAARARCAAADRGRRSSE